MHTKSHIRIHYQFQNRHIDRWCVIVAPKTLHLSHSQAETILFITLILRRFSLLILSVSERCSFSVRLQWFPVFDGVFVRNSFSSKLWTVTEYDRHVVANISQKYDNLKYFREKDKLMPLNKKNPEVKMWNKSKLQTAHFWMWKEKMSSNWILLLMSFSLMIS